MTEFLTRPTHLALTHPDILERIDVKLTLKEVSYILTFLDLSYIKQYFKIGNLMNDGVIEITRLSDHHKGRIYKTQEGCVYAYCGDDIVTDWVLLSHSIYERNDTEAIIKRAGSLALMYKKNKT